MVSGRVASRDGRGGDARTDRDAVILLCKRVNPRETHRCRRGRRIPARADLGPSPLVPALPATESCGGQPRCLRRTPCSVSCAGACVHKREGRGFQKSHGSRMSRLVARACTAHPKVSHQLSLVSSGLTSSSATSPATRTRALTDRWLALHRDARIHRRSLTAWGEAWEGRGSRTDASSLRMRKNQDGLGQSERTVETTRNRDGGRGRMRTGVCGAQRSPCAEG